MKKRAQRYSIKCCSERYKNALILESYLRGRENLELLEFEEENNLAQKMADLIIAEGINGKLDEIHGVECTLYYPGPRGFAGTADLVATYESQLSICDFKQKNSIMKESYSVSSLNISLSLESV